jgi:lysophospholipase L1-like esterase
MRAMQKVRNVREERNMSQTLKTAARGTTGTPGPSSRSWSRFSMSRSLGLGLTSLLPAAGVVLTAGLAFAQPVPPVAATGVLDQTPIVGFPGQYAPRPSDKYGIIPKSCRPLQDPAERAACGEFVMADWPRLSRYAAANAALATPKSGEKRVVFFGDSITDNWSKAGYGGFFPNKPYVNRGIGGQTTAQMLLRFYPDVIASRPRVVVILAGTNDIAGNTGPMTPEAIQDNLAAMVDIAQANGVRVVLASVLPISDVEKDSKGGLIIRSKDRPPETIKALNRWIADAAKRKRAVYLDYYSAMADETGAFKADLNDDGLHPNVAGYAVMAPLAEQAIAAALKR